MDDEDHNDIMPLPATIFTGGLDFEQEVHLQTISECISRGEHFIERLANGDEELLHQFEPLRRILTGISLGSVVPIVELITQGADPSTAIREVIAGVGGLMFFGGIEYAKAMGLNGVGVPITSRTYEDNVYPEEKPIVGPGTTDLETLLSQLGGSEDEEEFT